MSCCDWLGGFVQVRMFWRGGDKFGSMYPGASRDETGFKMKVAPIWFRTCIVTARSWRQIQLSKISKVGSFLGEQSRADIEQVKKEGEPMGGRSRHKTGYFGLLFVPYCRFCRVN